MFSEWAGARTQRKTKEIIKIYSMTSKTHGPHRGNNKSEYQECMCKMDKTLIREMFNKFESRKICVAGCIAEHNELPVIKICSDERKRRLSTIETKRA